MQHWIAGLGPPLLFLLVLLQQADAPYPGTPLLIVAKFVPGLGLVSTAMAGLARAYFN